MPNLKINDKRVGMMTAVMILPPEIVKQGVEFHDDAVTMLAGAYDVNETLGDKLIMPRVDAIALDMGSDVILDSGRHRLSVAWQNFDALSEAFKGKYGIASDMDASIQSFKTGLCSSNNNDLTDAERAAEEKAWKAYEANYAKILEERYQVSPMKSFVTKEEFIAQQPPVEKEREPHRARAYAQYRLQQVIEDLDHGIISPKERAVLLGLLTCCKTNYDPQKGMNVQHPAALFDRGGTFDAWLPQAKDEGSNTRYLMPLSTDGHQEDKVAQGWCVDMASHMGEYYQRQPAWFGGLAGDVSTEHQVLWLDLLYVLEHQADEDFTYENTLTREALTSEDIRQFRSYLKVGEDWKQRPIDANDVERFKTTIENALTAPLFTNHPLFNGKEGALPAQIKARAWLMERCDKPIKALCGESSMPTELSCFEAQKLGSQGLSQGGGDPLSEDNSTTKTTSAQALEVISTKAEKKPMPSAAIVGISALVGLVLGAGVAMLPLYANLTLLTFGLDSTVQVIALWTGIGLAFGLVVGFMAQAVMAYEACRFDHRATESTDASSFQGGGVTPTPCSNLTMSRKSEQKNASPTTHSGN